MTSLLKPASQWQESFPGGLEVKNPPANEGNVGLIPGSGRYSFLEEEIAINSLSCPGNPMDKGVQWATVYRNTKSLTQLSDWAQLNTSDSHMPRSAPAGSVNVLATTGWKASQPPAHARYTSIYVWITQVIKQMLAPFPPVKAHQSPNYPLLRNLYEINSPTCLDRLFLQA